MKTVPTRPYVRKVSDDELERAIADTYSQLIAARTQTDQVTAFIAMRNLIRRRSPDQVKRMEQARGLSSDANGPGLEPIAFQERAALAAALA